MESGLFCVLPWLTMAVFANIGGWIADTLITRGLSVTSVRKVSMPYSRMLSVSIIVGLLEVLNLKVEYDQYLCTKGVLIYH